MCFLLNFIFIHVGTRAYMHACKLKAKGNHKCPSQERCPPPLRQALINLAGTNSSRWAGLCTTGILLSPPLQFWDYEPGPAFYLSAGDVEDARQAFYRLNYLPTYMFLLVGYK